MPSTTAMRTIESCPSIDELLLIATAVVRITVTEVIEDADQLVEDADVPNVPPTNGRYMFAVMDLENIDTRQIVRPCRGTA